MAPLTDTDYLRTAIEVSRRARASGNHPFGAILVDAGGRVVAEAMNSFATDRGPGHAETNLAMRAAREHSADFLLGCTLYTSVEPCCMCAGCIYWANIGAVVFGLTEARLSGLTGDHPDNLTMELSCREVFSAGRRKVDVRGPFPELEAEILTHHAGFWDDKT